MSRAGRTAGYLGLSALTCVVGWGISLRLGAGAYGAAGALAVAWGLQAAAYGFLARRLETGRDASAAWVAGLAMRGVALGVAWLALWLGRISRDTAIVFGLALSALIILEAVWLASKPAPSASNESRRKT